MSHTLLIFWNQRLISTEIKLVDKISPSDTKLHLHKDSKTSFQCILFGLERWDVVSIIGWRDSNRIMCGRPLKNRVCLKLRAGINHLKPFSHGLNQNLLRVVPALNGSFSCNHEISVISLYSVEVFNISQSSEASSTPYLLCQVNFLYRSCI